MVVSAKYDVIDVEKGTLDRRIYAGSWKDIHIDPITAKFEGTATMKG